MLGVICEYEVIKNVKVDISAESPFSEILLKISVIVD